MKSHCYNTQLLWVPAATAKGGWYPYRIILRKQNVLELVGRWDEAEILLQRAIEVFQDGSDPQRLADSRNSLGVILLKKGRLAEALALYRQAHQHHLNNSEADGVARTAGNIGMALWMLGEREEALTYFRQDLEISKSLGDQRYISRAVGNIGNVCAMNGDWEGAEKNYYEKIKLAEEIGDKQDLVAALVNLGNVYLYKKDRAGASDCYNRVVEITNEIGNKQGLLTALGNLGLLAMDEGDYGKALEFFNRKLYLAREIGFKQGEMTAYYNIADLYHYIGEYQRSLDHLVTQLRLACDIGDRLYRYRALNMMGFVNLIVSNYEQAFVRYQEAVESGQRFIPPGEMWVTLCHLGEVFMELGRLEEAADAAAKAFETAGKTGSCENTRKAKIMQLCIKHRQGDKKAAEEIRALADESQSVSLKAEAYYWLGKLTGESAPKEKAVELLDHLYLAEKNHFYKKRSEELKPA